MAPSWMFFGMILAGGTLAVAGSTLYSIAREKEKSNFLSQSAKDILLPELRNNRAIGERIYRTIAAGNIPFENLQTGAWETVSKGNLLSGLNKEQVSKILLVYNMIYQSEDSKNRLLQNRFGINSAMASSNNYNDILATHLRGVTGNLTPNIDVALKLLQ